MSDRSKFRRRLRCDCGHECWERLDLNETPALSKLDEPCKCHTAVDIISGWEQCTGIKDNTGKLIYEGDILGLKTQKRNKTYQAAHAVKWDHNEIFGHEYIGFSLWNTELYCEIIGNIHEKEEE